MDDRRGIDQAMTVLSYLIAGLVIYGGVGWLLDRWLHTTFWLPLGIIVGAAGGVYVIIRRFGRVQ